MPDNSEQKTQLAEAERKKHLDELLDEALLETFPASDPPAICIEEIPKSGKGAGAKRHA